MCGCPRVGGCVCVCAQVWTFFKYFEVARFIFITPPFPVFLLCEPVRRTFPLIR